MRKIKLGAVVTVVVVVGLVGLDALAAFLNPRVTELRNWIAMVRNRAPANAQYQPDPFLHHALFRKTSLKHEWGNRTFAHFTNSFGMRDISAAETPKTSPRKRVLLLGDSFTEGIGVAYEKTFAGILATQFADDKVEIMNGGVASYSPLLYLRRAQALWNEGLRFDHVVVFLDISDAQDELYYFVDAKGDVVKTPYRDPEVAGRGNWVKRWIWENTSFLSYMWRASEIGSEGMKYPLFVERSYWTVDPRKWDAMKVGVDNCAKHLEELKAFLMEKKISLSLSVHPWPDQIYSHDSPSRYTDFWRDWASKHEVAFLDLFPAFINDVPAIDVLKQNFNLQDVHWSEGGHALVAKTAGPWLSGQVLRRTH